MNNFIQNQNQNVNTNTYQSNFNPYQWSSTQQFNRLPVYTAPPIHGHDAAQQFPMGPNSEIYLPDADENIIWWIRTDNAGNRVVTPFDIALHKEPEPVDLNALVARLNALEEKVNVKLNKSTTKRNANTDNASSSASTTTNE